LLRVGLVTALIFSIIYFIGGDILLNLMTDDQDVIRGAHEYKYWAAVIPIFGFLAFTWDGIFIGATRTREMLVSMAGATVVFFVTYYSLMPLLHNHGLWVAFIAYLGVRGIILSLYRRKISRQRSA
ncbi:MAG: MATE family efflux transporter, partial [Duncaniella sp.]|nr:MATE family efflux transporter [Duncaniella sp.]